MQITISEAKLRDYLLNPDHPQNSGKAKFPLAGGFRADDLGTFEAALIEHLRCGRHVQRDISRFGGSVRLVIEDPLCVPDGRTPLVRSAWLIEENPLSAVLLTAFPIDSRKAPEGENPFLNEAAIGAKPPL